MVQNSIKIALMNINDLNEISSILESEFDDFWNYNIFKSEIENPNSTYFVLKENNLIIGFAGIITIIDECEITNIVIKKSYRGQRSFKIINETSY